MSKERERESWYSTSNNSPASCLLLKPVSHTSPVPTTGTMRSWHKQNFWTKRSRPEQVPATPWCGVPETCGNLHMQHGSEACDMELRLTGWQSLLCCVRLHGETSGRHTWDIYWEGIVTWICLSKWCAVFIHSASCILFICLFTHLQNK